MADLEMSKRTNPMPNKRIKIVSYWSGIVKANGNGTANFEFDIPAFSGQVRLMAVAYKDQNFGSGETAMQVADPIVLSSALPRFLKSERHCDCTCNYFQYHQQKPCAAVASIQVSGPLQVVGSTSATVNLAANSEGRTIFQVVASAAVDVGKVKILVKGNGENNLLKKPTLACARVNPAKAYG